jgi:hypothetical protein
MIFKKEFEVRAVVWGCEDVPANDIEDCSDLFITGRVGETTLKTDVHYRSQNGAVNSQKIFLLFKFS